MEGTLCKIRDISRAIAAVEAQLERLHGMGLNEGMLLCTLLKAERLSSGELAEALGLTTSNASKVIRAVEERALVERVPGEQDKRQMYFSLTEKGREALSKMKCEAVEIPELLRATLDAPAKHG